MALALYLVCGNRVRSRRRPEPSLASTRLQSLRAPRGRVAPRPPGSPGGAAALHGQQRLRARSRARPSSASPRSRRADAAVREAGGEPRELPRRPVHRSGSRASGPRCSSSSSRSSAGRGGRSRSEAENVLLALLFAFGTVYFFTAVEGTVWFAAHVVGVVLVARVPPLRARRRASAARGSAARVLLRHAAGDEHARGALCARGLPGERGGRRSRQGRRGPSASTLRGRRSTSARSPAGTRRSQRRSSSSWQSAPGPTTRASTPGARRTSATST